jgi:hypothetical protein
VCLLRNRILLAVTGLVFLVSIETTKVVWSNVNLGLGNLASNYERILPVQIAFGGHRPPCGVNKINVVGESGLMYVVRKWEPIVYTSDDDWDNCWFSVPVRVWPSFIGLIHFLLANANNVIAPKIVAGKQRSEFPWIEAIFSFLVAPSSFFVDDIISHSLTPVFWNHLCVKTNASDDGMSDVDQPVVHQDRETSVWVIGQVTPSFNVGDFYPSSFASEQVSAESRAALAFCWVCTASCLAASACLLISPSCFWAVVEKESAAPALLSAAAAILVAASF